MSQFSERDLTFRVSEDEAGTRLDRVLGARFNQLSRAKLRLLFEQGRVTLNGRAIRKADAASSGDLVAITLPLDLGTARPAPDLDLHVRLARPDFIVVDKPAGLPTAATLRNPEQTLAGALLARYPEMAGVGFGTKEPGLVHRLDTQTSGLLLAARSREAHSYFRAELEAERLSKTYLAICPAPRDDELTISAPLGPKRGSSKSVEVLSPTEGKLRRTVCHVVERVGSWALLRIELGPGYRHQIRAHLASVGCPLVGDLLYGGVDLGLGGRHALHATQIAGTDPSGRGFRVESPLPEDLRAVWEETLRDSSTRRF